MRRKPGRMQPELMNKFPNPNCKESSYYNFLTCDNLVVGDPGNYEDAFDNEVESD